jgi:hypothetical protein
MGVMFDPHRPYQKSAKFTLIRLPLLTSRARNRRGGACGSPAMRNGRCRTGSVT